MNPVLDHETEDVSPKVPIQDMSLLKGWVGFPKKSWERVGPCGDWQLSGCHIWTFYGGATLHLEIDIISLWGEKEQHLHLPWWVEAFFFGMGATPRDA